MSWLASAFRLLLTQPDWLLARADDYVHLAGEQAVQATQLLRQQVWLTTLSAVIGVVGAVLAGVALLLWGALGTSALAQPWLLVLTPALPLLISGVFAALAHLRGTQARRSWAPLQRQWASDRLALQAIAPSPAGLNTWLGLCAVLASQWLQASQAPPETPAPPDPS